MNLLLESAFKCELRSMICFLTVKNKIATEIHQELCSVYGRACMSLQMVSHWRTEFLQGRVELHDVQHTRQPTRWAVFEHPPYSSDFAPSDFHLFPVMKEAFGGQRFDTTEEICAAVTSYYKHLDGTHYILGIQKLAMRYEKCLERYGNYVEK